MTHAMVQVNMPLEERRACQRLLKQTKDYFLLRANHEELQHAPAALRAKILLMTGNSWLRHVRFLRKLDFSDDFAAGERMRISPLTSEEARFAQVLIPMLVPGRFIDHHIYSRFRFVCISFVPAEIFLGMSVVSRRDSACTTMYIVQSGMVSANRCV